jgi:HJR/Mrr/RecB family endonuclease
VVIVWTRRRSKYLPWLILALLYSYANAWLYLPAWLSIGLPVVTVVAWMLRRVLWRLLRRVWSKLRRSLSRPKQLAYRSLDDVEWDEFEQLVADVFMARGYRTELTKRSGDQGIDVIAERKSQRVGIQCKAYSRPVGNDAVMAAVAGSKYYQCNRTVVACTSSFTRTAVELADKTGVELWDRKRLESELRWR